MHHNKNEHMEKTALKNFLDERGRLTAFPAKRKTKIYALCYLAEKFERDKKYTEKEVNEVLKAWHTFDDPATLRRELYDYKFLDREKDGSVYWLEYEQPTLENLLEKYF